MTRSALVYAASYRVGSREGSGRMYGVRNSEFIKLSTAPADAFPVLGALPGTRNAKHIRQIKK